MRTNIAIWVLALCTSIPALSQTPPPAPSGQAVQAELSVPFGVVNGKVVTSGDYTLFMDDDQPGNSFAFSRADVQNVNLENGTVNIDLRKPVRSRGGESKSLHLRLTDPAASSALLTWAKSATSNELSAREPTQAASAPRISQPTGNASNAVQTEQPGTVSYQAKHNHRIGYCTGRLIVTQNGLSYESVTDIGHSRQWGLKDVKEIKRDNPYDLKIIPFTGNDYHLGLIGTGIDNTAYKTLVDRITAARAGS